MSNQSDEKLSSSFGSIESYLLYVELLIGVPVNVIVLASIGHVMRQVRLMSTANHANFYLSHRCTQVSVVDLIVALLSVISLCKLLTRTSLQIACIHGICLHDVLCCVQGFLTTFLEHLYLWAVALFTQDRYVKHYKSHDYMSKCSHCVLYVTLCWIMFLTGMHLCGPIYGFSGFDFLANWRARYSCLYNIYTVLLVVLPAYAPILYWTVRISYRLCRSRLARPLLPTFFAWPEVPREPQRSSFSEIVTADAITGQTQKRSFLYAPSTLSHRNQSSECMQMSKRSSGQERSCGRSSSARTPHVAGSSYSSMLSSNLVANMSRSDVLTESRELVSVNLIGWMFLLVYTPNVVEHLCGPCFDNIRLEPGISFHLSLCLDVTTNVIIPLVLLSFHRKLCFSLLTVLAMSYPPCGCCLVEHTSPDHPLSCVQSPSDVMSVALNACAVSNQVSLSPEVNFVDTAL